MRVPLVLALVATALMAVAEAGGWFLRPPGLYDWWAGWAIPGAIAGILAALWRHRDAPAFATAAAFLLLALDDGLTAAGVVVHAGAFSLYLVAVLAAVLAFALQGFAIDDAARWWAWALAAVAAAQATLLALEMYEVQPTLRILVNLTWVGLPAWLAFDAWLAARADARRDASARSL